MSRSVTGATRVMVDKTVFRARLAPLLCVTLAIAVLAVYWRIGHYEFINYDDPEYVLENPHVRFGLTWDGILWALTSTESCNWHPLTWISHMVDCQLYGLNPSGHHLNNLLFHIGSSLLLFLSLRRVTGAMWRSFLVAFLFALHPLHVESVAWVSERKDVLSAFFWMAALWAYVLYVERRSFIRYSLVFVFFLLALMSKPMAVTFPFVLLLLDYWPFGRLRKGVLPEKFPFFVLSAASSVITLIAQKAGGALSMQIPLKERIANAVFSYGNYLAKTFLPYPLSFFYPHPLQSLSASEIAGPLCVLCLFTFLSFRFSSRLPFLTVGWLWYIGTLVPVIGLLQVGSQGMADRYTYIPLVGIFIAISWGSERLATHRSLFRVPLILFWSFAAAASILLSWFQIEKWKDDVALYEHAIQVNPGNYVALFNLGNAFKKMGRLDEAEKYMKGALALRPEDVSIHNNLGNVLAVQGRMEEAILHYREALRIHPDEATAHNNLANILVKQGKIEEGILHYKEALRIKPDLAEARYNLDSALGSVSHR